MTNTMNTPIEALEAYLPLRFESYKFRPDTGGPGRWRGGCGIERTWTLLSEGATMSLLGERTKIPPWGLQGGGPGALGEYLLLKQDGSRRRLPSKCTVTIEEGDTLMIRTPGGGGYGNPLERPPGLVQEDVADGLVSVESAERDYGVVIDPDSITVGAEATRALRKSRSR
jgi:N-methylhydantoinase B